MSLAEPLDSLNTPLRLALVAASFVGVYFIDSAGGGEYALRALYVAPVGLASWLFGGLVGSMVGALAAVACAVVDSRAGLGHARVVYSDAGTRALTYAAGALLVEQLRAAHLQLDTFAQSDPVTGIANVRGLHEAAKRELIRARRLGAAFTVVQLDIDGFKAVNEARGHLEGDRLLVAVAKAVGAGRGLDVAARTGANEFALLLPDTTRSEAEVAISRLRERLALAMQAEGWPVTFSIGVVTFYSAPASFAHAMEVADELMREVKLTSKNGVRFEESGEPAMLDSRKHERSDLP